MNEIDLINKHVHSKFYYEMRFDSYSNDSIIIIGGEDVFFSKEIEIEFVDVFSVICNSFWKINTSVDCIELVRDSPLALKVNLEYRVEVGYNIFKLHNEDDLDFFIIAKKIIFRRI